MKLAGITKVISALALVQSVSCIENAAVFKFGSGRYSSDNVDREIKTIPQRDSILNLAYDFGISQYYDIEGVENLDNIALSNNEDILTGSTEKKLILVINGAENPSDFFGIYETNPSFNIEIKDDRQSSLFKDFLKDVPNKLFNIKKQDSYSLVKLSNEISILTDSSKDTSYLKNLWNKYFHDSETNQIKSIWNSFKKSVTSDDTAMDESILKISKRSIDYINDEAFIDELTQLEFFLNDQLEGYIENDKVIINLDSLVSIFKKTGVTQTYETCKKIISKLIFEKVGNYDDMDTTVVVLPIDQSLMTTKNVESYKKGQHILSLKKRSLDSIFESSSAVGCFSNQLACIESTDSCSNHGICSLVGSCWKCVCSATVDENDRTSYWTGNSCEKVDYSSQFNLIFWTSLILVITIVSGVKLMYQCGQQELPGVLIAATVQTKKST